jgi:hypothetical protein
LVIFVIVTDLELTLFLTMSAAQPLLQTIEADDPTTSERPSSNKTKNAIPVVLTPTTQTAGSGQMATSQSDAESGK